MSTIKNKNNKKMNFCVYFLNLVHPRGRDFLPNVGEKGLKWVKNADFY